VILRSLRLSFEEITRRAGSIGLTLLSTVYLGVHEKHEYKCAENHVFWQFPHQIPRRGCPACGQKSRALTHVYTREQIEENGKKLGLTLLSEKYTGSNDRHFWTCQSGHCFWAKPNDIQQGKGCSRCYHLSQRKYATEEEKKIAARLRSRLTHAVRGDFKAGSAVRDLGCSVAELKVRLENMWWPGMSWANYGHGDDKWNIDHIRPLWSFNLTKREDVLVACHYSNLQPLWHVDNMAKGGKLPE
jgi:hypothetical protein